MNKITKLENLMGSRMKRRRNRAIKGVHLLNKELLNDSRAHASSCLGNNVQRKRNKASSSIDYAKYRNAPKGYFYVSGCIKI